MKEVIDDTLFIPELQGWRDSIRQQEFFQWAGLLFVIIIQLVGQFSSQLENYALFFIPLYYFSVARSDYIIHSNGGKAKFIEDQLSYVGNEAFQRFAKSYIAIFDAPLLAGVSILAKLLSPYPLLDVSLVSVCYWALVILATVSIWFATVLAKRHADEYEDAWHS